MTNETLKHTPLYDCHAQLGARFVPFAGYEMPVQYTSVIEEHHAVRKNAGLFDVSHMGEVFVTGPQAEAALQYMTCNDVSKLTDGKAQYSAILNERGGVVDDIIIYRFHSEKFLVCVNASNREKDYTWFLDHNTFDAKFEDRSDDYAQIAIQGPKAVEIANMLDSGVSFDEISYFHFATCQLFGAEVIAARTGYTGEDGLEFFIPCGAATDIWQALLELGADKGLLPAGLGARDSLRLEACYPLHGHELGDDITALESGIGWTVKLNKGDFIGRDVLAKEKEEGSKRKLVGFFVQDAGIVREQASVSLESGEQIGNTTSGTKTPTLDRALGLALVEGEYATPGTKLFAQVRSRKLACEVVKTPFYKRS